MRTLLLALLPIALLLSGCLGAHQDAPTTSTTGSPPGGAVGEPNGGASLRPPHGEQSNDGLHVVADADRSSFAKGGQVTFSYTVTNEGDAAIVRGTCEHPYSYTLRDADGNEHPLEAPGTVHCMALSNDPFPSGAILAFNATWNGTYAVGDHMEQAPEGLYTFLMTFIAHRGTQEVGVALALPVSVVKMGQQ